MTRDESLTREDVEIRTDDGISLRATVVEPRADAPKVVAVLAHAMFANRSQFDRPSRDDGWLEAFGRAGARAIAFDFRGHGESGTPAASGGFWSYDDLVQRDLPTVVDAARARADGAPVIVVGHSMGGSIALAAQGTSLARADALAVIAAQMHLPRFESSPVRRALHAAAVEAMKRTTARVGYFPARMLRQGTDDEAAPFIHDVVRFFHDDAWKSADGVRDYAASLAKIDVPVLAVASVGDRFRSAPSCVSAAMRQIGGAVELRVISEGDGGSSAPSHADLVGGRRSRGVRDLVVRWVLDRAR